MVNNVLGALLIAEVRQDIADDPVVLETGFILTHNVSSRLVCR